ncbi:hypothetical protein ACFQZE_24445 [Paenibacillus sp. GCM10027627]|uniref:hypothetical protein n=1 Tax=unclassified Paenibacillus TaxID=185978 RepID=UPI00363F9D9D
MGFWENVGNTISSAVENLMGGIVDTVDTVTDIPKQFNPTNPKNSKLEPTIYNEWMGLTLKQWQAGPVEKLTERLKQVYFKGTLNIVMYNAIIARRNQLYKDAKLPPPDSTLPIDYNKSMGEALKEAGQNIGTGTKNVIDAAAGTAAKGAGAVVGGAMNINLNFVVLGIMALFGIKMITRIMR